MDRLANNLMGFVIVAAVISIVLTILTIMYRRDKSVYVKIETLKEKNSWLIASSKIPKNPVTVSPVTSGFK